MSLKLKPDKSCGAVIIKDGSVLLVHQANNFWGFPKGHPEPGETELETALREVKEETGLSIIITPTPRFEFAYDVVDLGIHKTVALFLAHPTTTELTPEAAEVTEIRWVPFSEVEAILTFPEWRAVWRQILANLEHHQ